MRTQKTICSLAVALLIASGSTQAAAKVYQTPDKTYNTTTTPIDIAGSETGTTFVLTEGGKVVIFSKSGKNEIAVDKDFDRITTTPKGDKIMLSSSVSKKVQTIFVDFAKQINIEGSPFLGEENAPVVIIAFSDFQ